MNLCSIFSLDGIHVHLKPPLEITPLKFLAWYRKLLFCNDPIANWVLDGIANGFKVGFSGGQLTSANQNMHSAWSHPEIVDDHLLKELKRGSIAGPFKALLSNISTISSYQQIWFNTQIGAKSVEDDYRFIFPCRCQCK